MLSVKIIIGSTRPGRAADRCPADPEFWAVQDLPSGGAGTDMWVAAIAWPAAAAGPVLLREAGECPGLR